jgi:SAM-dependent methyltransferase
MKTAAVETSEEASDGAGLNVEQLYRHRFPEHMRARRRAVWKILCRQWFARYISPADKVLEVGGGYCEFINNIEASERVVVDINPETRSHAAAGVSVQEIAAERLADVLPRAYFDAVFMSNFLEHCPTREVMLSVLRAAAVVLKPGGRLLILGPNFRYCYKEYFDYFDHHLALTEKAVIEVLEVVGLTVEVVEPRTLPFSFRSRLPSWPWLIALYLRLPILWHIFGAQFFIVSRKTDAPLGLNGTRTNLENSC